MMKNKKGQVTIFIIIAIVIIAAIAFYFLIQSNVIPDVPGLSDGKETNPSSFLDSCLEDKLETTVETLMHQGGYLGSSSEPTFNRTFMFTEEGISYDLTYLCYFELYYSPCINQKPNLMQDLEDQIKEEIGTEVQICWNDLVLSLEEEGYAIYEKYNGFEVVLSPEKLTIDIDGELTLTKSGESSIKEDFSVIYPTRIYDIANVAREIINQEARFCNFDTLGYMIFYPQWELNKFRPGNGDVIYKIKDTQSNKEFTFAVRSCALPPGF